MRATTPRRWAAAASASRSASVMAALAFRDAPCDPGEPQRVRASKPVPHPVAVAVKSDGIEFVVAKRSEGVVDLHGSAHGHGSVVPALGNAGQVVAFGAVGGGRGRVQPLWAGDAGTSAGATGALTCRPPSVAFHANHINRPGFRVSGESMHFRAIAFLAPGQSVCGPTQPSKCKRPAGSAASRTKMDGCWKPGVIRPKGTERPRA